MLALTGALSSCVKEADIELPAVDAKLVLHCFITDTTDTIRARITWSKPVFDPNPSTSYAFENARDLTVEISDGVVTKSLAFDAWLEDYKIAATEIGLTPGVKYTITASHTNGQKIQATTEIPDAPIEVTADELLSENLTDQFGYNTTVYTFKTTLAGMQGEVLRYRLVYDAIMDTVNNWGFASRSGEGFIQSDGTQDPLYLEQQISYSGDFSAPQAWKVYVVLGDEAYYRYHQNISNAGYEGPFDEPTLVYSNVTGGLGVFGGFRQIVLDY